jgi:hypothetical protein
MSELEKENREGTNKVIDKRTSYYQATKKCSEFKKPFVHLHVHMKAINILQGS